MEVRNEFVFQKDDVIVRNAYEKLDNYKVVFHESEGVQKDLCAVYFSSNEIYYPNTRAAFTRSIMEKDKYEWGKNSIPNAHKHVYVRDIQKQWYIEGINLDANTPEKLLHLLKKLTSGYRVYTVGSSAGGFAAMLFGSLLKAEKVYAFNSQLNLHLIMQQSSRNIDPLLFKYAKDPIRSRFYKIENFVSPSLSYFYFQSCRSYMDIQQYESFGKKELINRIQFKTSNHGFPFLRTNVKYVMALNDDTLKKLSKSRIHPITFSIQIDGVFKTFYVVGQAVIDRVRKKIRERKESKS